MRTYFGSKTIDFSYPSHTVVAIGNFDGVHLGHRKIIEKGSEIAKSLNAALAVLTFNPHPTLELRPESPLKLLMTYEEKRKVLSGIGVDICIEEPFDQVFASTTAHQFFYEILKNRLHAAALLVGPDFSFGHRREGTLDLLRQFCQDTQTDLHIMPPVLSGDQPVSSSRIRDHLAQGDLIHAQKLLGQPFFYAGEIVHGDKRGRTIGFPTANMKCEEKFPLQLGVYATSVFWRNRVFASVTNIGTRPTFQSQAPALPLRIETYLLDQDFDLYGERLEVRFHLRLRDEKKFSSIDELKTQITNDVILAKSSTHRPLGLL